MLYRAFLRVVDLLPVPTLRVQKIVAFIVILTQGGIAVTGAIVRVTASGLGCPTWPQCFPGSFTPVGVSEVPVLHQAVEFGNRLLTFAVVLVAALIVLAVTRARRRREVILFAWLMPLGTVVQAVVGGLTVLTGLLWWTVAVHLVLSMIMVWLATLLYFKVADPDPAGPSVPTVPEPLRLLTGLSAIVLGGVLVAGTMVTGAGPHAGDKSIDEPVPRLGVEIVTLVHLHAQLLVGYLALLVGLGFALYAVKAPLTIKFRLKVLVGIVVAQAVVGVVQYFTDVPAVLVAIHVAGAGACTAATAAVWAACRTRSSLDDAAADKLPAAQRAATINE
ncbi:heme A synthase [Rhodococcus sp. PAMC28707]|uniref:COX15/CtaA family protein n=1 Tax=unclassified Rhodococcus (in: high G+C Gram-positive bacteria) TaxID=192944 RepID=UPI00109DAFA8|nr:MULTISPECIES: heme A synthase [unclassified Rhodococcus (in: high G+C Gram-positive bacteria)]QCB52770.1 heme A synthase [Rhodococcus sp. PAMC28705]QCB60682.1 heme A synthase [Rhodococcus sp. PAMC28707]